MSIEDAKFIQASDLNRYGKTLQENTYKRFLYKQLNSKVSYQIDVVRSGDKKCVSET